MPRKTRQDRESGAAPSTPASPTADFRPFNLPLYMRITTGVAVVVMGVVLWLLLSRIITRNVLNLSQQNAVAIANGLRNRLAVEQVGFIAEHGAELLEDSPEARMLLTRTIHDIMETFNIQDVRIYDADACRIYSTRLTEMGTCVPKDADVQRALSGETFSQVQRMDAIVIYLPVDIDEIVAGGYFQPRVLEIYLDIAPLQEALRQTNFTILVVLLVTMGLFYAAQNSFARRAQRVIKAQQSALAARNHDLETLQQVKDDLTHMIVHDMKNPLTGIMGYLSLLLHSKQQANLSPRQIQMLETANTSSQRLLDMTMNLLDITRMEEGKLSLQREPVDLLALVEEALQPFEPAITETDKHLHLELPADLPTLSADRDILRRILTNLISNAVKHTDRAGHITIRARLEAGTFHISVTDTGEGIPAEAIPYLFDKFGQVKSRKLGSRTDTGLGLAFCQMAVAAHGGSIHVESEVGMGSTFTVMLPATPDVIALQEQDPFTGTGE